MKSKMVLALTEDGENTCMIHPAKVRRLLKDGKAVVHSTKPFTIHLLPEQKHTIDGEENV